MALGKLNREVFSASKRRVVEQTLKAVSAAIEGDDAVFAARSSKPRNPEREGFGNTGLAGNVFPVNEYSSVALHSLAGNRSSSSARPGTPQTGRSGGAKLHVHRAQYKY